MPRTGNDSGWRRVANMRTIGNQFRRDESRWRPSLAVSILALGLLAGCNYQNGRTALEAGSPEEAAQQWRTASNFGDARSKIELAKLYVRGEGVPQDAAAAEELIRHLAQSSSWEKMWAQEVLGDI